MKTSITLSGKILALIDRHAGKGVNRSEFIENALRSYIASRVRREQNAHDLAIINRHAARLNREAKDVLDYQAPL
ncbi:MAG: ribbon-helix-helix protein, CopG family [Betaproteobacteria bacterium]|nr:ribbon-helix-helix protein, CopG family [Betaproteobacteria bacterium]